MKRLHPSDKERLVLMARVRFRHQQQRKNKTYNGYRYINVDPTLPQRKRRTLDLAVPPILCLKRHYDQSMAFLRDLRSKTMASNIQVRLMFENCQKITSPAMLLLLAEVHRSRLLRGSHVVTGTYPIDQTLLKRMCHTGFFDLLRIRSPIKSDKTFPMEYIKFRTGTKLDATSARTLREGLFGDAIKMRVRAKNQLQRGVTEAMLNALQHAYPNNGPRTASVNDRWWLTGHYHRPTGNLSIMFCDLGVGIPSTLPRKHPIEYLRQLASLLPGVKPDDGAMIYAGMRVGRTSTLKSHRGKGLNDLRQFIDQAGSGELIIYSKAGEYHYNSATMETHRTNSLAVPGTLIVWTVPIKSVTDGLDLENDDASKTQDSNSVF